MADTLIDQLLELRRSPLAGTSFGVNSPGLSLAEEAFCSLVEVHATRAPSPGLTDLRLWQLGPTWWLVDGPPALGVGLEVPLAGQVRAAHPDAHVVDVSAQRTTIVVAGPSAKRLLAHGCSIDLSLLPVGGCVQGNLAGAQVAIASTGPMSLRIFVRTAFARHLAAWLTDAARDYT